MDHQPRADSLHRCGGAVRTPVGVDRWELYALKHMAAAITVFTGKLHVLDHIVPLNHSEVCGLTVPWNLQIVPWQVNAAKSNR